MNSRLAQDQAVGLRTADLIPVELRGRLTTDVETAGRLLGLGRAQAYAAAKRKEIPTLPFGRRLVVPVPKLLALVGLEVTSADEGVTPLQLVSDHDA